MLDLTYSKLFFSFPQETSELVDNPTADKAMWIAFMSQAKKQRGRLNGMPPLKSNKKKSSTSAKPVFLHF